MKNTFFFLFVVCGALVAFTQESQPTTNPVADTRYYEMRAYYTHPGKFPDILARFRNNTMRIFEKHGMTNVGYFVPQSKPDSVLIYFLSYPNREARDTSWKAFINDPEWKAVAAKSEENGKIVSKVVSTFLTATDFSPALSIDKKGNRVFELRTYKTTAGHLPNLLSRFRDHTVKLFEKHGMTNVVYWTENSKDDTLIYLLAHKSKEAAAASFKAFRDDPDWVAVRKASEEKAGGSLTTSVTSEFLVPTDFSPMK
ncbi:MAG: NIPSNAP family protein [Cytophagaceae bacterium]|nr:NIPSNAP family protein [Cytophagaceae bacterium]